MRLSSILVVVLAALLLAAAAHAYGLKPGDQCFSHQIYIPSDELSPGIYYPLWVSDFASTGTVRLIISANVSSNVPVKLAVYKPEWFLSFLFGPLEVWATRPSTRIVGTYTVDLKTPGFYQLAVKNPSSVTARYTAFINVTMCGGPAVELWLKRHIESPFFRRIIITNASAVPTGLPIYGVMRIDGRQFNYTGVPAAPMGIASYGVMEVGGRYFAYELTTDAVKGVAYIPPNISVFGYWWNGTYYGRAFSVLLEAFVVARLIDGTVQYYFIRNVVSFDEKHEGLKVWNNIWNHTAHVFLGILDGKHVYGLILNKSAVSGNGAVHIELAQSYYHYGMPGSIPFGRVELEMRTRVDDGKIIVEFYANGQKYDEVAITPYAPATSAHIVIAPATTPIGASLDLELILGVVDLVVLNAGRIGLELYVHMNGAWVPPPSAWNVGSVSYGSSYASVVPQGVGSALVVPGEPNPRQLWAGTVVATPFGINITTSADLSPYARSPIDLGNGTRLILTGAYVNGRPAQTLSNVPLGSIVVLQYEPTSSPVSYATGWFNEGSTIVLVALVVVAVVAAIVVLFRKLHK